MSTVLKLGDNCAEVIQLRPSDPLWYYVISPKNTRRPVAISSSASYDEARQAAAKAMEQLNAAEIETSAIDKPEVDMLDLVQR